VLENESGAMRRRWLIDTLNHDQNPAKSQPQDLEKRGEKREIADHVFMASFFGKTIGVRKLPVSNFRATFAQRPVPALREKREFYKKKNAGSFLVVQGEKRKESLKPPRICCVSSRKMGGRSSFYSLRKALKKKKDLWPRRNRMEHKKDITNM